MSEHTSLRAYAIHDTDGGRVPAFPLLSHIYPTEGRALSARTYCGFDPRFYPVLPVDIVPRGTERIGG